MKKLVGSILIGVFVFSLSGARSPKEIPSSITLQETEALLSGESISETRPAETFGYPDPRQVATMGEQLDLSDEQKNMVQNILQIRRNQALYFGNKIVAEELLLDDLFRKGEVNFANLGNRLESIGGWRWRLRLIHLEAYLKTKIVLSPEQLKKYQTLRAAQSKETSTK
jgi:Spy/CpxP family protein refolding chaperone